jgi:hypothetical protein
MDVAWDEITPIDWEQTLARHRWEEKPDSKGRLVAYMLHVSCPRCQHEDAIDLEFPLKILVDRASPRATIHPEIYVECECTGEHAGRPAGEQGCGARSSMKFSIPEGTGQ